MKRDVKHLLFALSLIKIGLSAAACGDPEFTDGSGKRPVVLPHNEEQVADIPSPPTEPTPVVILPPVVVPPVVIPKSLGLTWFLSCETAMVPAPMFPSGTDLLDGSGAHELSPGRFADVPMTLRSQVCPMDQSRDIVFIVDISASMYQGDKGNDVPTNGTCNRLEAVKKVITLAGGAAGGKFAVVTFNADVVYTSPAFGNTLDEALGGNNPASVLCAGVLGTNYKAPLARAQTLFQTARTGSSREIYIVSDGLPEFETTVDGRFDTRVNGKAEAKSLRDSGALIATVMLGDYAPGSDYMKSFISSSIKLADGQDFIMHSSVSNTTDLTNVLNTLSTMAVNDVVLGELRYRAIGAATWIVVDLMPYRRNNEFLLPPLTLNQTNTPQGFEFTIRYQERRNAVHETAGRFIWATDTN